MYKYMYETTHPARLSARNNKALVLLRLTGYVRIWVSIPRESKEIQEAACAQQSDTTLAAACSTF